MSEPKDRDDELAANGSDQWLIAYDAALLSGISQVGSAELLPLPDDREDFEQDVACLELLHRVLRPGSNSGQGVTGGSGVQHAATPSTSVDIPKRVGRFEVLRELGRGGYGIVLLAVDPHLDRQVAIKIPRPEVLVSSVLRERFLREAETAGRLDHPNLVPVFEVGEDGPLWYIAAAYISGGTLSKWIASLQGPLSPRTAASLVAHLADAAQHAHSAGILHRDIKPGNVLMQPEGESGGDESLSSFAVLGFVPRLCDFGLAKLLDTEGDETVSGTLLGTPSYMAPEQATGRTAELGTATDVYGLGAILYELLTGTAPFRGGNSIETLRQVLHEEVVPPHKLRQNIDRDLEAICLKCLEKKPQQRYHTARELAVDLRRFLAGEPIEARAVTPWERLTKWCRREPALAGLAAIISLAPFLIAGGLLWSNIKIADALKNAQDKERKMADLLYVSDLQLAQQAVESHDYGQALQILKRQIPEPGGEDRREFAWRFLWKTLHREEFSLPPHPGDVYCLAMSPDGRRAVTVCRDGYTRVYETSTRKLLTRLGDHHQEVNTVAYSPDGQILATGGDDGRVLLRNTRDHQVVRSLEQPADAAGNTVGGLAFAPDGGRLYVAAGNRLHIWQVSTGEHLFASDPQERGIRSLAISPDGRTVAAVGNEARIWSTEWMELLQVIALPGTETIYSACFLHDGSLALGASKGRVLIHAPHAFDEIAVANAEQSGDVIALGTSADQRYLLAGAADRSIAVFDVDAYQPVAFFGGHADRVWDLKGVPSSSNFASAGADGAVKFWHIPTDAYQHSDPQGVLKSASWHEETHDFAFAPTSGLSALTSHGFIELTDHATGASLRFAPADSLVVRLHFSPDGQSLLACERSAQIHQWDVRTGKELAHVQLAGDDLINSALSPRGDHLAIGLRGVDRRDEVLLVQWPGGRVLQRLPLGERTLATLEFTPQGDGLYIASPGELSYHDARTLRKLRQVHCQAGESILDIDFLPDGQRMLTADNVPGASIRDAHTGKILARLAGHQGAVCNIAASPDGRTAATVCDNKVVRFWDLTTQRSLLKFADQAPGWNRGLYFSSTGDELVLAQYRDGSPLSVWEADPLPGASAAPVAQTVKAGESISSNWPRAFGSRRQLQLALQESVSSAAWLPNSQRLVVADQGGSLYEIAPTASEPLTRLPIKFNSPVKFILVAPDGQRVLTVDAVGHVDWWNTDWHLLGSYELEPGIQGIELNDAGTKILYHIRNSYRVTDAMTGLGGWQGLCPTDVVRASWFNDHTVAISSKDGKFILRDQNEGDFVLEEAYPVAPIICLARAPGDGPVAAVHQPRGLSLLNAQTGRKEAELGRISQQAQWIDSNRLLLRRDDWFDIYDTTRRKVVAAIPRTPTDFSLLSADSAQIAAFSGNQIRILWIDP